jgi:hypothetical protein
VPENFIKIWAKYDLNLRGGCYLECGKLENGKLECVLSSKNVDTDSPKIRHGKLEFNLENGFLENGVGN